MFWFSTWLFYSFDYLWSNRWAKKVHVGSLRLHLDELGLAQWTSQGSHRQTPRQPQLVSQANLLGVVAYSDLFPAYFWNKPGYQRVEVWNLFWVHHFLVFTGKISHLDWEAHGTLMDSTLLTSEGEFSGSWTQSQGLVVTLEGRSQGAKYMEDFVHEEGCKGSHVPPRGSLHILHLGALCYVECSSVCTSSLSLELGRLCPVHLPWQRSWPWLYTCAVISHFPLFCIVWWTRWRTVKKFYPRPQSGQILEHPRATSPFSHVKGGPPRQCGSPGLPGLLLKGSLFLLVWKVTQEEPLRGVLAHFVFAGCAPPLLPLFPIKNSKWIWRGIRWRKCT